MTELESFVMTRKFAPDFIEKVGRYFEPALDILINNFLISNRTYFIGLNGCQGSGKSTLVDWMQVYFESREKSVLIISLDDFYLSKRSRFELSERVHPLLATRGVPGTHDVKLMCDVLYSLRGRETGFLIPRFDKSIDDCCPKTQWTKIEKAYDVVILEGWCWGVSHQSEGALVQPVNNLEASRDSDRTWRGYVNEQIKIFYEPLYELFDSWLMLKAPTFDVVYRWRLEQEQHLVSQVSSRSKSLGRTMTASQISTFIQYFERLTRHALDDFSLQADVVWELDVGRQVVCTKSGSQSELGLALINRIR